MKEAKCDKCGEETPRKNLGKIRGKQLCKSCRKKVREDHRELTIEVEGIADDLKKLDNKIIRERRTPEKNREYVKRFYHKKHPNAREYNKDKSFQPKIKGSKRYQQTNKSNAYLTFEEQKQFLRMLMQRGLEFEEAKERINNIVEEQKRIRKLMKEENKSEKDIQIRQAKLLEELWQS